MTSIASTQKISSLSTRLLLAATCVVLAGSRAHAQPAVDPIGHACVIDSTKTPKDGEGPEKFCQLGADGRVAELTLTASGAVPRPRARWLDRLAIWFTKNNQRIKLGDSGQTSLSLFRGTNSAAETSKLQTIDLDEVLKQQEYWPLQIGPVTQSLAQVGKGTLALKLGAQTLYFDWVPFQVQICLAKHKQNTILDGYGWEDCHPQGLLSAIEYPSTLVRIDDVLLARFVQADSGNEPEAALDISPFEDGKKILLTSQPMTAKKPVQLELVSWNVRKKVVAIKLPPKLFSDEQYNHREPMSLQLAYAIGKEADNRGLFMISKPHTVSVCVVKRTRRDQYPDPADISSDPNLPDVAATSNDLNLEDCALRRVIATAPSDKNIWVSGSDVILFRFGDAEHQLTLRDADFRAGEKGQITLRVDGEAKIEEVEIKAKHLPLKYFRLSLAKYDEFRKRLKHGAKFTVGLNLPGFSATYQLIYWETISFYGLFDPVPGFWLPVGLFSTNFKSSDGGVPFAAMPVGLAWGVKFNMPVRSFNAYIGVSVIGNWLIHGQIDKDGNPSGGFNLASLTAGALVDLSNFAYVGYAYGWNLAKQDPLIPNPGHMFVIGLAPGGLQFLKNRSPM